MRIVVVDSGRGGSPADAARRAGERSPGSRGGSVAVTASAWCGGSPPTTAAVSLQPHGDGIARGDRAAAGRAAKGRWRREPAAACRRLLRAGAARGGAGRRDRPRLRLARRAAATGRCVPSWSSAGRLRPGKAARPARGGRLPAAAACARSVRPDRSAARSREALGLVPAAELPAGSYLLAGQLRQPSDGADRAAPALGPRRRPVEIAVSGAEALLSGGAPSRGAKVDVVVTTEPDASGPGRTYVAAAAVPLARAWPRRRRPRARRNLGGDPGADQEAGTAPDCRRKLCPQADPAGGGLSRWRRGSATSPSSPASFALA